MMLSAVGFPAWRGPPRRERPQAHGIEENAYGLGKENAHDLKHEASRREEDTHGLEHTALRIQKDTHHVDHTTLRRTVWETLRRTCMTLESKTCMT